MTPALRRQQPAPRRRPDHATRSRSAAASSGCCGTQLRSDPRRRAFGFFALVQQRLRALIQAVSRQIAAGVTLSGAPSHL